MPNPLTDRSSGVSIFVTASGVVRTREAERVAETGKMLQLEPMPALERRWIHIALREHPDVMTQSVGEEPNRRIVVLPRSM